MIKAIGKMKSGKATGPTGITIDKLKTSGDVCIDLVTEMINDIIAAGVIPQDWQVSYIMNRYKGKGDAVERGSYRGLKLFGSHHENIGENNRAIYQRTCEDR